LRDGGAGEGQGEEGEEEKMPVCGGSERFHDFSLAVTVRQIG
jgi:hypothetical protein